MSLDQLARDAAAEVRDQVATIERPKAGVIVRRSRRGRVATGAAAVAILALVAGAVALLRIEGEEAVPITTYPVPAPNGWVALTERDRGDDTDVYLVREGETPRRLAGSDTDTSAQVCPAFSPDGGRLVFGQVTGSASSGYEDDAELVIIEVGADGSTSGTTAIPVEDLSAPPCPLWSPDGRWLAFGAGSEQGVDRPLSDRSRSEVWLVDTVTEELRRLAGETVSDLEWLPGTDELAIADNGIHVYSVTTGEDRSLGIDGAAAISWSPDGTTVAFTRTSRVGSGEAEHDATSLWLADADGTNERQLNAAYGAVHGVGPVWSPDGRHIAYQRVRGCCESHEVVVVSADDNPTEVVIEPPTTRGSDGPVRWYPWSVTWSPDGSMLLYIAWNDACYDQSSTDCRGRREVNGLLAVPVDTTQAPFVLAEASWLIGAYDGQPWLPMQTWGRQPPD